jgi:hypothetical protein
VAAESTIETRIQALQAQKHLLADEVIRGDFTVDHLHHQEEEEEEEED